MNGLTGCLHRTNSLCSTTFTLLALSTTPVSEFHHAVPSERLIVDRAWTGKHMSSPRLRYHSKGRAGRSHFRTSMLSVRLREMTADEALAKRRFGPAKLDPAAAAKLNPRAY